MDAGSRARTLLPGLADEALSGRIEPGPLAGAPRSGRRCPARCAASWTARSVYTRPGATRYATAAQLSAEERLVAQAQTQGRRSCRVSWPRGVWALTRRCWKRSCASARRMHASA